MKISPPQLILLSYVFFFTACSQQFEGSTSLLQAYGDGYQWAQNRQIHHEIECDAHLTKTMIEALIAKGCLAYVREHSGQHLTENHIEETQVRSSAEWTTQPSEDDFDLGFMWAEDEGIQIVSECRTANTSESFVAGCAHYVQGE